MRVTGWTWDELRRQPARIVRAHFFRIFAGLYWDARMAGASAGPPPSRASFRTLEEYAAARRGFGAARRHVEALERVLWPEDKDG